jgi:cytochrome b561
MTGTKGYDPIAKLFHWAVVLLLAAQFGVAWTMPEIHRGTQPETLINLHLSLGSLILLIMALRLVWRFSHPVPLESVGVPRWQVAAARAAHLSLYLLLLVMPVLGWANANSRGWDVTLFGLVPLPSIMAAKSPVGHTLGDIHTLIAYVALGLVGLHVAGALYHHVRLKDGTLARMLPGWSKN